MNDVEAHELVTATARSARVAQRSLARAPRAVNRWAAESWDRVATSGSPSGTAATAIATPSATA